MRALKTYSVVFLCFGVASCGPVMNTFEVIPDEAKSCIADAREAKIACRGKQLPLYQSCMNEKASLKMQADAMKLSEIQGARVRFDQCLSSCLQGTHTAKNGNTIKNTKYDCVKLIGSTMKGGIYTGICADTKMALDRAESAKTEVGGVSCGDVYNVCEQDYKLTFERCGGRYETRCVENCKK